MICSKSAREWKIVDEDLPDDWKRRPVNFNYFRRHPDQDLRKVWVVSRRVIELDLPTESIASNGSED
jgi:hypothetical protein